MSQSNYNIPNQSAPAVRAQLNSVFGSIATNNSGSAAPSTTFAHQWWYDTTTNILKMRNAANSGWINVAYFDQTAGAFRILDDTQVVNTSGVQTGLLGDQSTATWEAGTGTLESLVSPAKVAAAITALTPPSAPGVDLVTTGNASGVTTITMSGLTLTPYKLLRLDFDGLTHSSTGGRQYRVRSGAAGTPSLSRELPSAAVGGTIHIDLASGSAASTLYSLSSIIGSSSSSDTFLGRTGITTATTSIVVSLSASGNITAGAVRVYGFRG